METSSRQYALISLEIICPGFLYFLFFTNKWIVYCKHQQPRCWLAQMSSRKKQTKQLSTFSSHAGWGFSKEPDGFLGKDFRLILHYNVSPASTLCFPIVPLTPQPLCSPSVCVKLPWRLDKAVCLLCFITPNLIASLCIVYSWTNPSVSVL